MKTIGIIGGMSWESSQSYYRLVNTLVKQRLGGLHSAKVILNSLDFAEIEALQMAGDWGQMGEILTTAALKLELAGAECILIATNTMHKVADQVAQNLNIPLLHIADATGFQLKRDEISKVALLGTRFTMEQLFYKERLAKKHGIEVIIPNAEERELVHNIIYQELCRGVIAPKSKSIYLSIVDRLAKQGAQAVILGCTEIGLLINQDDTKVKLYDTTEIHAEFAVNFALGQVY